MRRLLKYLVICMMICFGVGSIYGSETNYITEAEFANALNAISKVGTKMETGETQPLTREKAAKILVDYLCYKALSEDIKTYTSFTDVTLAKGEIELVSQLGLMRGVGNGLFAPNQYVTKDAASSIMKSLKNKLQMPSTWQHACYAISSSSQMDWIKDYDAISFGWAEVFEQEGNFVVSNAVGDFKVPSGFEIPMDKAKAEGVEAYLMIYFDGKNAQTLLSDSVKTNEVIAQIISLTNSMTFEGVTRSFDGITIDFEGLADSSLKAPYVQFLQQLSSELKKHDKKLIVAVQPTLYYKGYDYKGIGEVADHVILMAHDYGAKSLKVKEQQAGITTTPLTPIDDVYLALREAKEAISDTNKIALQFSFASIQWQKQNGVVLNERAYTPSYDKIATRIQLPGTSVQLDANLQSTYATYEENGITNTIWYEDAQSIKAKMELARLLGINSFSYWRLGIIPNEIRALN